MPDAYREYSVLIHTYNINAADSTTCDQDGRWVDDKKSIPDNFHAFYMWCTVTVAREKISRVVLGYAGLRQA